MQIEILPSSAVGHVTAPPSKSMAHRLLICAGLAKGESVVSGIAPSEDVLATIDCLRAIGARCEYDGDTVHVTGVDATELTTDAILPCRECGSTLRFFIPLALLSEKNVTLTGSARLLARPQSVYEDICREKNLYFENNGERITVCGPLQSGIYELAGDVSSQFISGLLFALPLLEGDSEIRIKGPLESRPYLDLTVEALARFGVSVEWKEDRLISIRGGQRYAPRQGAVEGDYSNAAFFEALNYVGGDVTVDGLCPDSLQGDRVYAEAFRALAAGNATVDLSSCPDLGPVLFAVAAELHGGTFTGTRRLRIKESDRAAAMASELLRLGAEVEVEENRVRVLKRKLHAPTEPLDGHNDHRIVMSLSVLLTKYGGAINGAEAVAKSMPDFFPHLEQLGVKIKRNDT